MIFAYPSNVGFNGRLARKSFQAKKGIDLSLGGDKSDKILFQGI
jgi:hypothetical protein